MLPICMFIYIGIYGMLAIGILGIYMLGIYILGIYMFILGFYIFIIFLDNPAYIAAAAPLYCPPYPPLFNIIMFITIIYWRA